MITFMRVCIGVLAVALSLAALPGLALAHPPEWLLPIKPEQKQIAVRDPASLPHARIPLTEPPVTVADSQRPLQPLPLSLDDAIRIALEHAEVVRVLAGTTAVSSGRTIYDPAIANTVVDEAKAQFDPRVDWVNRWTRTETPFAFFDPNSPQGVAIGGTRVDAYTTDFGLTKPTITGGNLTFGFTDTLTRRQPGVFPLNPENRYALDLGYTQPLLQGGGIAANWAPTVIARIDTERSYFQLKSSLQDLLRGVVEAYWGLVFARTDVWAREQQLAQGRAALERAEARKEVGLSDAAQVAQARVAMANFRSNAIAAQANMLQREGALRNILGLPVTVPERIVPMTPPISAHWQWNWELLVVLAEERRPDLVELKLIIEADQQRLLIAQNQAKPRLDLAGLYRWNGLEGETPNGGHLTTQGGEFTDWDLSVNFSVPLGLRRERAVLRRQELIISRDHANLTQGLHGATHLLATSVRDLEQYYAQYDALRETRIAAQLNLEQQAEEFRAGRSIFLNVLQAITDWGNAVSAEAQSLALYNSELANLERQTGTILETHGVHLWEERTANIGPLAIWKRDHWYPSAIFPGVNADIYPRSDKPAEQFFELDDPLAELRSHREELPPPRESWPSRTPEPMP